MGSRDDFFSELRDDFRRDPEESFLYQYLKQEKEGRIESGLGLGEKRRDLYVLLSQQFRSIRGEADAKGKREYLRTALEELLRNEKLRPAPTVRECLEELGCELGGPEVFRGMKGRQRWSALLELLTKRQANLPYALVRRVHEEMLRCCLIQAANTLLEDADRTNNPRKDRMLDLYFSYQARGLSEQPSAPAPEGTPLGLPGAEELRELEAFCARVNAAPGTEYDWLFLPVCIDPVTGAALCLLGRRYLSDVLSFGVSDRGRGGKRDRCQWSCFYVTGLNISGSVRNSIPLEEISVSWSSDEESIEEMLYPNLREALNWFRNDILRDGKAAAYFRDQNGPAPADCPERFRAYFEP